MYQNSVAKKTGIQLDVVTGERVNLANEVQAIEKNRPWDHWQGMPSMEVVGKEMYATKSIIFENEEDYQAFQSLTGYPLTEKTRYLNLPIRPQYNNADFAYIHDDRIPLEKVLPKSPIYIVSKGRYEKRPTSDLLCKQKCPHYIVVEPQEVDEYKARVDSTYVTILPMDMSFKKWYFRGVPDDFMPGKTGAGAARNFALAHAKENGHKFFWTMDDNLATALRFQRGRKRNCLSPAMWRCMEWHMDRFDNVLAVGPSYGFFVKNYFCNLPFITNTRIYSCTLTRTDMPDILSEFTMKHYGLKEHYPGWEGLIYNEDTEMSLRILKAGYCTIQYQAFLVGKMATQSMKGGNTTEIYMDGTRMKSEVLAKWFPDDAEVRVKFSRVHHQVDYNKFKSTPLHVRDDYQVPPDEPCEWGMKYVDLRTGEEVEPEA